MIFLPDAGHGGGGGGGGNGASDAARQLHIPGTDTQSVAAARSASLDSTTVHKAERPPIPQLTIPAEPLGEDFASLMPGTMAAPSFSTLSLGPGSGGGAGQGSKGGDGPGLGPGEGSGSGGNTGGGPYIPGNDVTLPRVVQEVKPQYTAGAMSARIQGAVWLECVVRSDGSVGSVRVVRSLDSTFGLDREAVDAARRWRFVPAMRRGTPVDVLVIIELQFTLR
jgi:protein TonB